MGKWYALSSRSLKRAVRRWEKKGVVRDPAVHLEVLEQFLRNAAEADFSVKEISFSPIRGPEGNIEYLGHLTAGAGTPWNGDLKALVEASHDALEGERA